MLYDFRDRLVLEYKRWWFVWEESWEAFRPITGISWNGTTFIFDDREYCSDLTDPLYGYGTQTMKDICDMMAEIQTDALPEKRETLPMEPVEWFYDRRVSLTPCAPRDRLSWKRLVQSHGRTCRAAPKGTAFTRRRVRT
jgi:hypothetical protein